MADPDRRIKVAYVLKVFPRLSETFVLNEVLELQAQGVDVRIFSLKAPTEPRFHAPLAELERDVIYLPPPRPSVIWPAIQSELESLQLEATSIGKAFQHCLRSQHPDELKHFLQALLLVAQVRKRGIQHVHAHFASSATRVALLAHLLSGLGFSFTAHAKDIYHRQADHALIKEALNRCRFAVTVTDYNVAQLERVAPAEVSKIQRIYNGARLDQFVPVDEVLPEPPKIVAVGRLVEKKGFRYLLEACHFMHQKGIEFRCRIIGTGDQEAPLAKQIEDLELSHLVSLAGARSHQAVIEELAGCRLAVLPCIVGKDGNRDALPTVLLEAMAVGKPVVSTDLQGVTEIVDDGETGFLVPQRDSTSLAGAIAKLLSDRRLARALGKAGREKAERLFDLSRNVAQLRECISVSSHSVSKKLRTTAERCV